MLNSWNYMLEKVGIAGYLLIPISVISLAFLAVMFFYRFFSFHCPGFIAKFLNFSKIKSVELGFFGTVIGVSKALSLFKTSPNAKLVEEIMHKIGTAFASTAYGLSVYLFISLFLFLFSGERDE